MADLNIQMFCGTGSGKSAAAIGQAIRYACVGKSVFIVRFLKGKASLELDYLKRLEPEIKLFSFDKFDGKYCELTEEEKKEEQLHIQNGLNYAKKVLQTGECDVLVLDEILDLISMEIISVEDVIALTTVVSEETALIMTGTDRCEQLWPFVTKVTEVTTLKRA